MRLLAVVLALLVAGCGGGQSSAGEPPGGATSPSPVAPVATPEATEEPTDAPPEEVVNATTPPTEDPATLGPLDVLEAFTQAQEAGDFGWAQSHVVESARHDWDELAAQMSEDDLVSAGLAFREEAYRLDFQDEKLAVFWSDVSRLHLVMTREDGAWRIDPRKTDEMNVEDAGR